MVVMGKKLTVTRMDYRLFTREWLERAERVEGSATIDKADKFISLWIAFNGWMKKEFGEDLYEGGLIDEVKEKEEMKRTFNELRADNNKFSSYLNSLSKYRVVNMKEPENKDKWEIYDGTFGSLIDVLYQIRCNLFHGRKLTEKNKIDIQLVHLAFDILHPLFKRYLENHDGIFY